MDKDLTRRSVLQRSAAAGLMAVPAAGLLSACVGAKDEAPTNDNAGTVTATNPLGVKEDAELEVYIFNGGLGTKYATDVHIPSYNKLFPKANVKFSQTEEISTVLTPRFSSNTPPDMVNNAGSKLMDMGKLVGAGQAADLTDLFDAASLDIAGKKVRDTLVTGAIEQGTFKGKPYVLNYVLSVYGMWYSGKLFADNNWKAPTSWADFTALLDAMKAKGITPYAYAGANAAYYQYLVILTTAAKIGGADVLKNIDNLAANAWKDPAVVQAAKLWGEIGVKYMDKAHLSLRHTEVQLQQNQYKVGFYPSGSWLENEQTKDAPEGFMYQMAALPQASSADKLPASAIFASAGEMYFVAAKGKNVRGGKEYLRHMLSNEGARKFTEVTGSLSVVQGAAEGLKLTPGTESGVKALAAAGKDTLGYRWPDWYKKLDDECRNATNELMFQGGTAEKFTQRMQTVADAVKADSSIEKFER
jgi:N-acetylglucosamine transport system substrate-binding protein